MRDNISVCGAEESVLQSPTIESKHISAPQIKRVTDLVKSLLLRVVLGTMLVKPIPKSRHSASSL